jgi:DNA-binding NtrC family response regulator
MENYPRRVLLVEDDEDDYLIVGRLLSDADSNFELAWVDNYDSGLDGLIGGRYDVYLVDYLLGERNGLDLLREAKGKGCVAPVILLTGQGGYEVDIQAMQAGASDYLVKGQISADLLDRSIRHCIERNRAEVQLKQYRDHLEELVEERTFELERTNESLHLEIAQRKSAEAEREMLIAELREALARVKQLSGLLPICASCKKIRDDKGYWRQIEAYIRDHSEADFSHGICPDCARELYPWFPGPRDR